MRANYLQIICIILVAGGLGFIFFLYLTEPKTIAEVATHGQVVLGTYEIDRTAFENGLASFRRDDFVGARTAFDRADPEKRDAGVQFYVAYSYYRQGWGRVSNDDTLFTEGLKAADRVIAVDPNYRSTDASLQMKTPSELKAELEDGLTITPSDFNPLRVVRERK